MKKPQEEDYFERHIFLNESFTADLHRYCDYIEYQLEKEKKLSSNVADYCIDCMTSIKNQYHIDSREEGMREAYEIIFNKLTSNPK
jgi:hypothetical protein